MTSNPLVGTWKLVSWENRSLDGQVSYPLGEDAVGYISYSQDGYVFVAMMRSDRTQFTAGDLLRASAEEKVHAAETYVTYTTVRDHFKAIFDKVGVRSSRELVGQVFASTTNRSWRPATNQTPMGGSPEPQVKGHHN